MDSLVLLPFVPLHAEKFCALRESLCWNPAFLLPVAFLAFTLFRHGRLFGHSLLKSEEGGWQESGLVCTGMRAFARRNGATHSLPRVGPQKKLSAIAWNRLVQAV